MILNGLVYIDTKQNYYARWIRDPKQRTHGFISEEPLTQYWVEVLRATPELLEQNTQ